MAWSQWSREALKADPYCGSVFVFRSKRKDRIKMIAWDGTGMVLVTKWLEESGFTFPPIQGRRGCADGDSTLRFSRGSRLDQGCREGREKTEGSRLRSHVFLWCFKALFALVFFHGASQRKSSPRPRSADRDGACRRGQNRGLAGDDRETEDDHLRGAVGKDRRHHRRTIVVGAGRGRSVVRRAIASE